MKITIIKGDITRLNVDVIVNSANRTLMGGGGVDGAIHRAAGNNLLDECIKIRKDKYVKGLPTGDVVITSGFDLPAKCIIHTVSPMYGKDDLQLLKNCYNNSLKLAEENGCKTIAFPAIGTGSFGVPIAESVLIVKNILKNYSTKIEEIILVLYSDEDYDLYMSVFN